MEIIEIENFLLEDKDLSSQSVLSDIDTPLYPGSDTSIGARDPATEVSGDELTFSAATRPKVNVMKHAETGLVVCTEGHEPMVVLQ